MKKYSIIALLVTLVASLSSCNDDFTVHSLQKKPTYSCTWTEFTDIMYTDME